MLRLALKNVRHSPRRLILTGVAITLGVALVSSTFVLTNTTALGIGDLNEAYYGTGRVVITPDPDFESDPPIPLLTDDLVRSLDELPGIEEVAPRIDASGDAPLLGKDGEPFTDAPTVIWNWSDNPEVARATIVNGREIRYSGEILIDIRSFDEGEWTLGDTLQLATFGGVRDYTLVGTVRFGDQNVLQGASMVYLSLEDAQKVRVGDGGYDRIDLVPELGIDHTALIEPAEALLPIGARATTSEFLTDEINDQVGDIMGIVDSIILVFAFVSVLVGSYLIANTFRVIVTQRIREIGLLRAIAASGKQVRRLILLEASAIASVASAIGIALGWLMAFVLLKWMESEFGNTYNSVPLPLDAVLLGLGVGFGVTLISALVPAIHASRVPPLEALRESATHSRKPLRLRTRAGWTLCGIAAVLIMAGLVTSGASRLGWVGIGAMLLVIGVTLLGPTLLVHVADRLDRPFRFLFRVPGTLAIRNIRREPRRSANPASALLIGVLLLSFMTTILGSIREYARERVSSDVRADLYVSSSQLNFASGPVVGPEAYDIVSTLPGVEETMRWGFGSARLDGSKYRVGAVDSNVADSMYFFDAEPRLETIGNGVFIGPALQKLGYEPGDVITLDGPVANLTLTIRGEFSGAIADAMLVDWGTAERLFGSVETISVLLTIEPGVDLAQVRSNLDDALANFPLIESYTKDELLGMANDLITIVLVLISALLSGAILIAILGVVNTLFLSVTERTREIGLIRAVGLRRGGARAMVHLEAVVVSIYGAVVGGLLGTSLAVVVTVTLDDLGTSMISLPWGLLAVYFGTTVLVGFVAAALPAHRAARLGILEAVTTE